MMARVLLYCLIGGLPFTLAGLGDGHVGLWWLAGSVLAASFVPVAMNGPRSALAQFAVIAPVLVVVTVFCSWTEAMVFVPRFRENGVSNLVGATITYVMAAAVLALLARALKLAKPSDGGVQHRPALVAAAMVSACGLAYVVYYLIFGSLTYQYFTYQFYPDGPQQVAQLGWRFWAIEIGRGLLMTVALLPIVFTLRLPRWPAALAVGAIAWVAGGLAPLIAPNEFMGTTQRMIHIVEIFTQNVPLGVTAVLLLRPRSGARTLPTTSPGLSVRSVRL
jgi:hypothetical protein